MLASIVVVAGFVISLSASGVPLWLAFVIAVSGLLVVNLVQKYTGLRKIEKFFISHLRSQLAKTFILVNIPEKMLWIRRQTILEGLQHGGIAWVEWSFVTNIASSNWWSTPIYPMGKQNTATTIVMRIGDRYCLLDVYDGNDHYLDASTRPHFLYLGQLTSTEAEELFKK